MFCFYHRFRIRRALDEQGSLPEGTRRHVEGCSACAEVFVSERKVVERLRAEAQSEILASEFLVKRIMATVKGERISPRRSRQYRLAPTFVFTVAVCLLSVAIAVRLFDGHSKRQASVSLPPEEFDIALRLETLVTQPYRNELEAVQEDVSQAGKALFDCLPVLAAVDEHNSVP